MGRGKYGARAANRMAEAEATLIGQLQADVREAREERDEARAQLDRVLRDFNSDARIIGERLASEALAEMQSALDEAEVERAADRGRYARQAFDVIHRHGGQLPMEGFAALAEVFGMGSQVGSLLAVENQNRHSRRANAKFVRTAATMRRRGWNEKGMTSPKGGAEDAEAGRLDGEGEGRGQGRLPGR